MGKLVPLILIVLLIWIVFFHKSIPKMARRSGRGLRDVKDVGVELLDGEEVPGSPLAKLETSAGRGVTAKILVQNPLADAPETQERVLEIGRALAEHRSRREINYRFAVLEGVEPNAIAVPGGSIFLTRGLVSLCSDDDMLAGLIAHEMAHIELRHALKSVTAKALTKTGIRILSFGRNPLVSKVVGEVESALESGYSDGREHDADALARRLAARADFSKNGLPAFLRMLRDSQPSLDGRSVLGLPYFRSHPRIEERLEALGS